VPLFAGLTAAAFPETTYSWKASLTYGEAFTWPQRRWRLLSFGILEEDVEVPVFVEDAGINQLVLELLAFPSWL